MKKFSLVFLFSAIIALNINAANTEIKKESENSNNTKLTTNAVLIKGKIIDKNNQEPLAGVAVNIEGTNIVSYTDFEGNFIINGLQPGNYKLNTSYISYKETSCNNITISQETTSLKVELEPLN